jgi:hypothetical protein
MRKLIVYNDTEVLYVENEASIYNSTKEGEFILVQTLPLAKKMLQARGINTSIFNLYTEGV